MALLESIATRPEVLVRFPTETTRVFRQGSKLKLRRLITAAAILAAPLAAVGVAEVAAPVAAHAASGACPTGYQGAQDALLFDNNSSQEVFNGYGHTWYPMQSGGVTNDPYNQEYFQLCWTVTHVATGADQGFLFIWNRGSQGWLGENSSHSYDMTFTGSGPGMYESLAFTCQNTTGTTPGDFAAADSYFGDPLQYEASLGGATNVVVGGTSYDLLGNTSGFCT